MTEVTVVIPLPQLSRKPSAEIHFAPSPAVCSNAVIVNREQEHCSLCLDQSANLQLGCSHVFHDECILNQLKAGWTGVRISFNFMRCAECRAPMTLPAQVEDSDVMREIKELLQQHQALSQKLEQMAKDLIESGEVKDELEDPAKLVFYPCFKCQSPYYVGNHDCAAELNIKFENLLCPPCLQIENKLLVKAATEPGGACALHGDKFALYKCTLCCGAAIWQCGSMEFYCSACHDGGEMTRCAGANCHIKVPHKQLSEGRIFIIACNACEMGTENQDDVGIDKEEFENEDEDEDDEDNEDNEEEEEDGE
jgi:hypothetical protein